MSWRVTIEVSDGRLEQFFKRLDRLSLLKMDLKQVDEAPADKQTNGKAKKSKVTAHAKPDTRMKMTGKVPRASELLASGLDLFERMEKEHGIGSITVEMFRNQIDANELGEGSKLQTRLKHEGYLEYLE